MSVSASGAGTHTGKASRDRDQDDAPLSQKPEVVFFFGPFKYTTQVRTRSHTPSCTCLGWTAVSPSSAPQPKVSCSYALASGSSSTASAWGRGCVLVGSGELMVVYIFLVGWLVAAI